MAEDMGTFRVDVELENPSRPGERRALGNAFMSQERRPPTT